MLLLGVPIGYANTNTLLDTGTMVAKGSKVRRGGTVIFVFRTRESLFFQAGENIDILHLCIIYS